MNYNQSDEINTTDFVSDITTLLKKLCSDNYLESDNNGRWTIYKIKQKVDTSKRKVDTSTKVDTHPEDIDNQKKTSKKLTNLNSKVDTLDQMVDTSKAKIDTFNEKGITRSKLNKVELETEIMKVCKNDYLKMEEVAIILNKSVDYLKNKIFPVMMREGKLEKRFPLTHNHPEQGYKTKEEYVRDL